jgi:hypothetical protein
LLEGVDGSPEVRELPCEGGEIAYEVTSPWAEEEVLAFQTADDPSDLLYGTFIGGSDRDSGWGIAVDGGGNAYVTGSTWSSDFPTTTVAFDPSYNGGKYDAFVVKLDPNGSSLLYSTFIGGSDYDSGYGIAVDGGGNAYVTGGTRSSDFPTTPEAFDRSYNGGYLWWGDAFVIKLNPDGSSLSYGTFIGGSNADFGLGIAVDRGGNAYVTGGAGSSDFPKSEGAFDPSHNGGHFDAFAVKFNPNGSSLLYGTFIGGSYSDYGYGIAVDGGGNAYVTGVTWSSDFPTTPEAFDPTCGTDGNCNYDGTYYSDAFVVKLNPTGSSLFYGTFIGGSYSDYGRGIAVDGGGNAYVTGHTDSSDFPTTPGAFDPTCGTDGNCNYDGTYYYSDAFVVKLNPTGSSLFYGTFIGGSSHDSGLDIAVDGGGNAYVSGSTSSSDFPTTSGAFDTSHNGRADAFVVKLDPNGSSLFYGTFIGGSYSDYGECIAVDGGGNAYVTGHTDSSDFPTTPGAFDPTCGTDGNCNYDGTTYYSDAFVVKLKVVFRIYLPIVLKNW